MGTPSQALARHPTDPPRRYTYGFLLACTVLVAAVTFVLSFSGLDDYGRRVAHLGMLSPLVPIGVDGLTLCAVAATFLLRHARFRVRLYAWSAFAVAMLSSVAGNLSHAFARRLSWDGMVGAAAWPILLALASHMVIVVRRNMDTVPATPAPAPGPVFDHPRPIGPMPAPAHAAPVHVDPPARPARKRPPTAAPKVAKAHRLNPDASNPELARKLRLSESTVKRYRPAKVNGRVPDLAHTIGAES